MNFIADESVDRQIVARMRLDGHVVRYVAEMLPGIPDDSVLALANEQSSVLLTADKDFGEMVFRQGRFTFGILLVRLGGLSPDRKAEVVSTVVDRHGAELSDAFGVLTPTSLRIRRFG